jgi:hypothetical protein
MLNLNISLNGVGMRVEYIRTEVKFEKPFICRVSRLGGAYLAAKNLVVISLKLYESSKKIAQNLAGTLINRAIGKIFGFKTF